MFENAEISVPCPECKTENTITIGKATSDKSLVCKGCDKTIELETQGLEAGLKKASKATADFRKSLKGFGKR